MQSLVGSCHLSTAYFSELASWAALAPEHGIIALDAYPSAVPGCRRRLPALAQHSEAEAGNDKTSEAAAEGAAKARAQPKLHKWLSVVPEGEEEEGHAPLELPHETPAETPAELPPSMKPPFATACELLEAAAAAGLVPRPGTGSHWVHPASSSAGLEGSCSSASLLHLDRIPFTIRAARPEDANALYRLQAHALVSLQRELLQPEELQARLTEAGDAIDAGGFQLAWLAEIGSAPAAALVLKPTPCSNASTGDLSLVLAAVHPGLDERAEVFCALRQAGLVRREENLHHQCFFGNTVLLEVHNILHPSPSRSHFVLQYLMADVTTAIVRQGNCRVLQHMAALAGGSKGAETAPLKEEQQDLDSPEAILLRIASTPLDLGAADGPLVRRADFTQGADFDLIISAVAEAMHELGLPPAQGSSLSLQPSLGGSHSSGGAESTAAAGSASASGPLSAAAVRLTAELVAAGAAAAAAVGSRAGGGSSEVPAAIAATAQHQAAAEEVLSAVMAAIEGFMEAAGYASEDEGVMHPSCDKTCTPICMPPFLELFPPPPKKNNAWCSRRCRTAQRPTHGRGPRLARPAQAGRAHQARVGAAGH